jgi:hypothetical protein
MDIGVVLVIAAVIGVFIVAPAMAIGWQVYRFFRRENAAQSQSGINVNRVSCPKCSTPMPRMRRPRNMTQFLWGGGTCQNCGCEMDKWGHPVSTS